MAPLTLKFSVSAPGKVILFGEHSVVYGKPAVAASINKRSVLVFETRDNNAIDVNLSALQISLSVPLNVVSAILDKFAALTGNRADTNLESFSDHMIESIDNYERLDRHQRVSIFCLFYLLYRLFFVKEVRINAFKISVSSDISVGAGTGSSASYSVCLAAALYHYFRVSMTTTHSNEEAVQFSTEDKKLINEYAFACEQIIHGRASGIDNFVCTFGSIVEMIAQDFEKNNKIFNVLENVTPLRIFLVNTGVGRSTAKMVQSVRDLHSRNQVVVNGILDVMGALAKSACSVLIKLGNDAISADQFKKLEDLVSINHGLLASLGVSHSALDTIVNITKKYDLHSKLTGAGGGGYAFTIIPPYQSNDMIFNCKRELEGNGFTVEDITIGGTGVNIEIL